MDMEFTEDQRMLKDMVDRFVTDCYSFETRQSVLKSPDGWSRQHWRAIAERGLLMIPVTDRDGGLDGGGVELMIVGEAFGRGLVGEPWLAFVVAAAVLGHAGGDVRAELLPAVMAGDMIVALGDDSAAVAKDGRVSGIARFVLAGGIADRMLVAAVTGDGEPCVLLIDPSEPGVQLDTFALHGGGLAAHVTMEDAPVLTMVLIGHDARTALRAARSAGIAAVAADALGAAQAAFDLTVDYLKMRVQFGQPIGTNQALQHRAAEMYVELEQLRSAAILAACSSQADEAEQSRVDASVRIVTAKAARFIAQQAVQLHGGIGVTDELSIGHYFLRLTADGALFGDADDNVARLADMGGNVSAAPYHLAA